MNISVAMIVRNEAKTIARAIDSVKALQCVNEIVVVDTGSTDDTWRIAQQMGAKVFHEAWTGDFSYHRNRCEDRCTNEWVLALDGDEWLESAGSLATLDGEGACDAYDVLVQCVDVTGAEFRRFCVPRLHRRSAGRWMFRIHEQFVGIQATGQSGAVLMAEYDDLSTTSAADRLQALLEDHESDPDELHHVYFLAAMCMQIGDFENCIKWTQFGIDMLPKDSQSAVAPTLWTWLIRCAITLELDLDVDELLLQARRMFPAHADLHHIAMSKALIDWYNASRGARTAGRVPIETSAFVPNFRRAAGLLGVHTQGAPDDASGRFE